MVLKRLNRVSTTVTLTFDPWSWPFAWTSLQSLVLTPENFMMIQWREHSEKCVKVGQTDGRSRLKNQGNLNRNPIIFIQEDVFENVVCQNDRRFLQGVGVGVKWYVWDIRDNMFQGTALWCFLILLIKRKVKNPPVSLWVPCCHRKHNASVCRNYNPNYHVREIRGTKSVWSS